MALREDYYTPCTDELNRKIALINRIIDDITPNNYDEEFGLENCLKSEDISHELKGIISTMQELVETLEYEKKKLAQNINEI